MKKKTGVAGIFVIIMFALFSAVFLCIGIFGKMSVDSFMSTAQKTDAMITEIEVYYHRDSDGDRHKRHNVYVEYTVDGKPCEAKLNSYNSTMYKGKIIEVYYDPYNPEKIMSDDTTLFIIFICVGGVFAAITVVVAITIIVTSRKHKNLITNGTPYTGTIIDVRVITNIKVNGRHPYRADCEVINPITQEKYLFSSENVYSNIRHLIGSPIIVYIEDTNPANHFVDINRAIADSHINTGVADYRN